MLYVYVDKKELKILYLKKTLLGQQEANFFEKSLEVDLTEKGRVTNIDILASAIKEGLTNLNTQDKEIFLILPQESFHFLAADVPGDIAPSAIESFVYDKARSTLSNVDIDNSFCDYYIRESDNQKHISFFALDYETLQKYYEALNLLGLKLVSILPETLAVFKLFEKTLRKEKKETILYASYSQAGIWGYLFDSLGLISDKKWDVPGKAKDTDLKSTIKTKVGELKKGDIKLNRIILSGELSDKIRQDTFTKDVGVWTNPLKRIIPNFYEEYVKQIVVPSKEPFPLLVYDVCFGAFVFSQENKEFQMLKKPLKPRKRASGGSTFSISRKDIFIFLISLIASFLVFFAFSNFDDIKSKFTAVTTRPAQQKKDVSPTSAPTTPTTAPKPTIVKEKVRIKVLNGSGTAGKASDMKDVLIEAGYQEILTGNADSFDFEQTVIQSKKDTKEEAQTIKEDLSDSVKNPKMESLDEDETADIVIIIGTDFE